MLHVDASSASQKKFTLVATICLPQAPFPAHTPFTDKTERESSGPTVAKFSSWRQ